MNLASIRAALAGLVTTYAGIAATSVIWQTRPMGWTGPVYALCHLSALSPRGRDEVVWTHDGTAPPLAQLTPHALGQRATTWQVTCCSYDSRDGLMATDRLEALRDALSLPEVVAALRAVGVGVEDTLSLTDSTDVVKIQDQRLVSAARLDVRLSLCSDVTGTATGYAEHWGITGTATGPTGATVPVTGGEIVVP